MSSTEDFMLTTYDNQFNPFTQFDAWFKEDHRLGHNCCELLALVAAPSDILSDELEEKNTIYAMDQIIKREPTIYRKVRKSDFP